MSNHFKLNTKSEGLDGGHIYNVKLDLNFTREPQHTVLPARGELSSCSDPFHSGNDHPRPMEGSRGNGLVRFALT